MPDLARAPPIPVAQPAPNPAGVAVLTPALPAVRLLLRGADAIVAASAAFGVALPVVPCRAATVGARVALWLGPDEWLLLAPETETGTLGHALSGALAGIAHALVDISHRQTALLLEGPGAASMLNAGVPLDLAPDAFPVGMVTRTLFDKTEIVLWRTAETSFRIEVWRSFAPYLVELLTIARDEEAALRSAGLPPLQLTSGGQ
jgi:sarcosine oxidase subunit gamma